MMNIYPLVLLGGWDGLQGGIGFCETGGISHGYEAQMMIQQDGRLCLGSDVIGCHSFKHSFASRCESWESFQAGDLGWSGIQCHGRGPRVVRAMERGVSSQ